MNAFFYIILSVIFFFQVYIIFQVLHVPPTPVLKEICWGKTVSCKKNDTSIRQFKINVSEEVLEDTRYRLKNAIIPEPMDNAKQHYGFNGNTLKQVIDYWLNKYNWQQREIYLNQYPQYKTNIQGLDIHFIRVRPKVNANVPVYPIIMCHGWGASVREFYEVIPLLTTPHKKYGFAFEVIIPSLPGFAFSEATTKSGLGAPQIAVIFKNLMLRMGHNEFYVHGGDWGSVIIKCLATLFPDHVLGLHTNLPMSDGKLSWMKYLFGGFWPALIVEKKYEHQMYPLYLRFSNFLLETGYYHIQATKPDTVGTAVANSPVGVAAYLLEKFSTLANTRFKDRDDAGLLERYTYDKLIDNLMLYWVTGCITSASRLYYEGITDEQRLLRLSDIPLDQKIPCALAKFPNEIIYQSDFILKDKYTNIVQSTDFKEGGHFAALENGLAEPFAEDMFSGVDKMRKFHLQRSKEEL